VDADRCGMQRRRIGDPAEVDGVSEAAAVDVSRRVRSGRRPLRLGRRNALRVGRRRRLPGGNDGGLRLGFLQVLGRSLALRGWRGRSLPSGLPHLRAGAELAVLDVRVVRVRGSLSRGADRPLLLHCRPVVGHDGNVRQSMSDRRTAGGRCVSLPSPPSTVMHLGRRDRDVLSGDAHVDPHDQRRRGCRRNRRRLSPLRGLRVNHSARRSFADRDQPTTTPTCLEKPRSRIRNRRSCASACRPRADDGAPPIEEWPR